jgi:hypothetical protein
MKIKSAKPWQSSDKKLLRVYVEMTDGRKGFWDCKAKTVGGDITTEEAKEGLELSRSAAKKAGTLGAWYAPTPRPQAANRATNTQPNFPSWHMDKDAGKSEALDRMIAHDTYFGD